jgi:hypothetical protein
LVAWNVNKAVSPAPIVPPVIVVVKVVVPPVVAADVVWVITVPLVISTKPAFATGPLSTSDGWPDGAVIVTVIVGLALGAPTSAPGVVNLTE